MAIFNMVGGGGGGGSGGEEQGYRATQGPAPYGFHVPTKDEWVALCGVLTTTFSLASNSTTMGTYLKMPPAGNRSYDDIDTNNVGSVGYYWSSTCYDNNNAYNLALFSANLYPQLNSRRSYGFSVRCFKNSPIIPTSSWTTLYQGSGSAGIFWNSADGLISVSGDGTTWYTIMDKNLGATTVFNQGDTLTDANVGGCFQWGNNYMFPGTKSSKTITRNATQVNVTGYGPGNYYSSSTWITTATRQNSANNGNNLRGGVDGNVPVS